MNLLLAQASALEHQSWIWTILPPLIGGFVLVMMVQASLALRHRQRRREWEHAERMKALEAKRVEYEEWLKRREVFLARAEDGVVKIYAGMKPDAAAERLAMVNAELAAAILMKLDSRKAGVILNEMDQKAAATLTGIMASAARRVDPS